jgi:hypothetical protein
MRRSGSEGSVLIPCATIVAPPSRRLSGGHHAKLERYPAASALTAYPYLLIVAT